MKKLSKEEGLKILEKDRIRNVSAATRIKQDAFDIAKDFNVLTDKPFEKKKTKAAEEKNIKTVDPTFGTGKIKTEEKNGKVTTPATDAQLRNMIKTTEKRNERADTKALDEVGKIAFNAAKDFNVMTDKPFGEFPSGGEKIRTATLWDSTINSIRRGYINSRYNEESFKAMNGWKNKKAYYEELLKNEDFSFVPDSKAEEWISNAMGLLGQQVKQWTDPQSITSGLIGAGSAAIAGQLGPQIVLPEEIATVPGAFIAGIQMGSAKANFEIEAGAAYNEMIENGISHETARKIATAVGAGNAALEAIQLDDLVKSYKIVKKLNNANGFVKKLASYLIKRGVKVGSETAQEVGQEAVTMTGVNIAGNIDGKGNIIKGKEFLNRLGDTAGSSAMSFGILGLGGDLANSGDFVKQWQIERKAFETFGRNGVDFETVNKQAQTVVLDEKAKKDAYDRGRKQLEEVNKKLNEERKKEAFG